MGYFSDPERFPPRPRRWSKHRLPPPRCKRCGEQLVIVRYDGDQPVRACITTRCFVYEQRQQLKPHA